jgi:GNAT superfamily N-acetyltransferase
MQHHRHGLGSGHIVVRPATLTDLDETSALIASAFSEFARLVPDDLFERFIQDSMAIDLSQEDRPVFVAEHDGRIAGTVTFYRDASRTGLDLPREWASFRTLAVHPAARRQGIANRLVSWCIALAGRQSSTLAIHTAEFMTSARNLYTRVGFERSPAHDHMASDLMGTDPAAGDALVMGYRLALPPLVAAAADQTPVLLGLR